MSTYCTRESKVFLLIMENEIWKPIPNYDGYEVSNYGRVKSLKLGRELILKPFISKGGYYRIELWNNNTCKSFGTHQLVAMAFLGHKPNGQNLVVNHINFDRKDNRLENLEVITQRQNANLKHIKSSSKYTGVTWNKKNKKYRALIVINRYQIYLGAFTDEKIASEHYNIALNNLNLYNGDYKEFRCMVKRIFNDNFSESKIIFHYSKF